MFQWQPVRTQRFLAPSALLSTFPPPWLGASELLGTEGLWLSISMIFSSGVAILATLGTSVWRGIFYQGSFRKPLPKEAQPARQLVRLCLLDSRWLRWARTPSEMGFIFSSNMMSSHPPHSTPPGIWWGWRFSRQQPAPETGGTGLQVTRSRWGLFGDSPDLTCHVKFML